MRVLHCISLRGVGEFGVQIEEMEGVAMRGAVLRQGVPGGVASCSGQDGFRNSASDVSRRRTCGATSLSRQQFFEGRFQIRLNQSSLRRSSCSSGNSVCASLALPATLGESCFDQSCAKNCPINNGRHIERWVEESVPEIVRHIQDAPFLHYVFDTKSMLGRPERQKVPQDLFEKPDCWLTIREALSEIAPDGIIFVQKLGHETKTSCCLGEYFFSEQDVSACPLHGEGSGTDIWGVLVQARSVRTNACYLLKTTRVRSSAGVCTRFCLTRAKCFGTSQITQLENVWLLD